MDKTKELPVHRCIRLNPRFPSEREMIAKDHGWDVAWRLTIKEIEKAIASCTHGDSRHPQHALQKELFKARFELLWLTHPANKED